MVFALPQLSSLRKLADPTSLLRPSPLTRDMRVERKGGQLVLRSADGLTITDPGPDQLLSILGRAERLDMCAGLRADDLELFRQSRASASRWVCANGVRTGSSPTTVLVLPAHGGHAIVDLRRTERLVLLPQPPTPGERDDAGACTFLGALPPRVTVLPAPPVRMRDPAATVATAYARTLFFLLSAVTGANTDMQTQVQVVGLSPAMMAAAGLTFAELRRHFESVVERIGHAVDGAESTKRTACLLDVLARIRLVPWDQYAEGLDEGQLAFETRYCAQCFGYGPGTCGECRALVNGGEVRKKKAVWEPPGSP